MKSGNQHLLLLFIIGLIVVVANQMPVKLIPIKDTFPDLTPLLTQLAVVALFMERSIEVFLSAWRSSEADRLDNTIERLKSDLTKTPNDVQIQTELKGTEKERVAYRSTSRRYALWGGLLVGVLISAAGLRLLGYLYTNPVSPGMQQTLFHALDIALTGGLLAGGSGLINDLMKVYTSFTQETRRKMVTTSP